MININKLIVPEKTLDDCYQAGRDYALNGANTDNCHFSLFSSPENTAEWERGREAEPEKE